MWLEDVSSFMQSIDTVEKRAHLFGGARAEGAADVEDGAEVGGTEGALALVLAQAAQVE